MIDLLLFLLFIAFGIFLFLLPFLPFIIIGYIIFKKYREASKVPGFKEYLKDPFGASSQEMQTYAATNSYQYDSGPSDDIGVGSIAKIDRRVKATNIISGTLFGSSFRFYELAIAVKYLLSSKTHVTRVSYVAEVQLDYQLPHVYVQPKNTNRTSIANHDYRQELNIGGDFGEHFSVYSLEQNQLDVLSLFPPDVQAAILANANNCEIEIIGNKIYMYWPIALDTNKNVIVLDAPAIQEKFIAFQNIYKQLSQEINRGGFKQQTMAAATNVQQLKRGLDKSSNHVALIILLVFFPLMVTWALVDRFAGRAAEVAIGSVVGILFLIFFIFTFTSMIRKKRRYDYARKKFGAE